MYKLQNEFIKKMLIELLKIFRKDYRNKLSKALPNKSTNKLPKEFQMNFRKKIPRISL